MYGCTISINTIYYVVGIEQTYLTRATLRGYLHGSFCLQALNLHSY